jgi:hypothetical protein
LLQVRSAIIERARAAEERELWSAVGFRHVVDLLARAGKPLVLLLLLPSPPKIKINMWLSRLEQLRSLATHSSHYLLFITPFF